MALERMVNVNVIAHAAPSPLVQVSSNVSSSRSFTCSVSRRLSLLSSSVPSRSAAVVPHVPSIGIRALKIEAPVEAASVVKNEVGAPDSLDYRIFYTDASGKKISPWHDIPLSAGDGYFNMICEIPKETSAKMEVATDELLTPIKQDTKKGKLRFYPYNINWNYGLLPQTWEDPSHINAEIENSAGDNDPVDVVEIGEKTAVMGEVYAVKPLAVLAMIDEGELDWKIICIRADDPKCSQVDGIADVEKLFPGELEKVHAWFRDYKIPDGKPANKFGLNDKPADKDYALRVIEETNGFWKKLVTRETPSGDLSLA